MKRLTKSPTVFTFLPHCGTSLREAQLFLFIGQPAIPAPSSQHAKNHSTPARLHLRRKHLVPLACSPCTKPSAPSATTQAWPFSSSRLHGHHPQLGFVLLQRQRQPSGCSSLMHGPPAKGSPKVYISSYKQQLQLCRTLPSPAVTPQQPTCVSSYSSMPRAMHFQRDSSCSSNTHMIYMPRLHVKLVTPSWFACSPFLPVA